MENREPDAAILDPLSSILGYTNGMPIADSQVAPWHRENPLPLLPSGPDGVHGSALHRT